MQGSNRKAEISAVNAVEIIRRRHRETGVESAIRTIVGRPQRPRRDDRVAEGGSGAPRLRQPSGLRGSLQICRAARAGPHRALAAAAAIIAEASLSFLGLGQQPPNPSWGSMLNTAKNFLQQAPWMAIWPGLAISGLVLSLNLFGDGLRDALDPRGDS
jgi:hypothetical protein